MTGTVRRPGRPPGSGKAACGTRSGYHAHRRRGEDPCRSCLDGRAAAAREYRSRCRTEQRARQHPPISPVAHNPDRAAQLAVAAHATGPDDCRALLEMLGLAETRRTAGIPAGRYTLQDAA